MRRLIFVCLLASQVSFAGETATKPDDSCRQSSVDSYEVGLRLTEQSKSYSGKCIDTSKYRAIKMLRDEAGSNMALANVYHKGKFWTATFRTEPQVIDSIMLQTINFATIPGIKAAHMQMRIKFKDPKAVVMYSQSEHGTVEYLQDLIVSYQAAMPPKTLFNFIAGMKNNYAFYGSVTTMQQRYEDDKHNQIRQFVLKLTDSEKGQLAEALIRHAGNLGMDSFYRTLDQPNCASEAFDVIDQIPTLAGRAPKFKTPLSPDPIAGPAIEALKARNLFDKEIETMNVEMGH